MIEKDLVVALKSTCQNVFPVFLNRSTSFPAMTYQVVFDSTNQATNGNYTGRDVRFQVDIYSHSYEEAKTLKSEVVKKVIELKGGDISAQDLYDNENELHRQLLDFNIRRT